MECISHSYIKWKYVKLIMILCAQHIYKHICISSVLHNKIVHVKVFAEISNLVHRTENSYLFCMHTQYFILFSLYFICLVGRSADVQFMLEYHVWIPLLFLSGMKKKTSQMLHITIFKTHLIQTYEVVATAFSNIQPFGFVVYFFPLSNTVFVG